MTKVSTLLLVVVLATGACSSGDAGKTANPGAGSTSELTDGDTGGTPVQGGSLVYGLEADTSGGWCLYKAQLAISGVQVARAIYDTLTLPGSDGKIHPFLAQSVTPNANNTLFTIKLRPDIRFHDGSALTADVVKENLDHYRNDSPLLTAITFNDVKSVDVVDNSTLTVATKVPWPAFPWFLWSGGRIGIMAKAQMGSPDCDKRLIGTGPFKFKSWVFGDKFVAVRNPDYWRKDKNGVRYPYLDQITFVPQEDEAQRLDALESGDFNMMQTSDPIQIAKIRREVKKGSLVDTESGEFAAVTYLMLNSTRAPFDHLSARRALAYAFDRDTFNKLANDNVFTNASGPFAPGVLGHLDDTGYPSFDPAKAKAAALEYRQETGKPLTFTLLSSADADSTQAAVLMQDMFERYAGIKVALSFVGDESTYISDVAAKKFDAVAWRNHPGADPDTQYIWWHCGNSPTSSSAASPPACDNATNFGGFNDRVINSDLQKARSEPDQTKRTQLYEEVNKEFAKQLWNIWQQWVRWTIAYAPKVHGVLSATNPDGGGTFPGLASGHPVESLWCDGGHC